MFAPMSAIRPAHATAILTSFAALALLLVPQDWLPVRSDALALTVFAIGLWATSALPEHLTSIVFFTAAMLLRVAPPDVVFSGFSSAAWWLVFAGLVMGVAVKRTGLGERVASRLSRRFGASYLGAVAGIMVVGMALGFLMPSSMGRAVLLMPIALAVADQFGFPSGSRGRTGIVMSAAFGSHVPTFAVLPANVPNMVMVGAAEKLYAYQPSYGEYLILHFPVLGLLKAAAVVLLIVWLFPDRVTHRAPAPGRPPMSRDERRLGLILALALAFWVTDVVHHVSPAWVAMAAAVLCLAPFTRLVPAQAFSQQINYGSLFFVAGIMGLGAMVDATGLGKAMAGAILSVLPLQPGQPDLNFLSLLVTMTLVAVVTTLPGQPAVMTPLAGELAAASGLPLESVLMLQVLGFSTILLPFQSAPLVVATQLGGESLAATQKVLLGLAAITVVVLFPLDWLWWRLLGWLP